MVCLNCKISFVQRKCIASLQKMWPHLTKSVLLLFILNTVFRSHRHIYNHFHNYLMHKMYSLQDKANLPSKFGLQLGLYLKRECYSFNNFTFFIHPLTTGLFWCFLFFLFFADELVEKFTWLKELCHMWSVPVKSAG